MNVIGNIIELIMSAVLAPAWFSSLRCTEDLDAYKIFFRLIYPKWLSFKQKNYYRILQRKSFRRMRYERKRLDIGVMFRNA